MHKGLLAFYFLVFIPQFVDTMEPAPTQEPVLPKKKSFLSRSSEGDSEHKTRQNSSRSLSPDIPKRHSEPKESKKLETKSSTRLLVPMAAQKSFSSSDPSYSSLTSPREESSKKSSPRKSPKVSPRIETKKRAQLAVLNEETFPSFLHALSKDKYLKNIAVGLQNEKSIVNCCGPTGYTLLHHAVLHLIQMPKDNTQLILTFLRHPGVNSLIQRNEKVAYQFITQENVTKFRDSQKELLLRTQFDHIVYALLFTDSEILTTESPDSIRERIEHYFKKIPDEVKRNVLPSYAIQSFFSDAVLARLQEDCTFLRTVKNRLHEHPNGDLIAITQYNLYLHNDFTNDPNQYHPLYNAVAKRIEPVVALLLANPYINTIAQKNLEKDLKLTPFQLLTDKDIIEYPTLYTLLKNSTHLEFMIRALCITNPDLVADDCPDATITQKIDSLFKRIFKEIIPNYATTPHILKMIKARRMFGLDTLRKLSQAYKDNVNYQDEFKNTLLHYGVYLHDEEMIKQLVRNPKVLGMQRNYLNLFPQSLPAFLEIKNPAIRNLLFTQDSLERWFTPFIGPLVFIYPNPATMTEKSPEVEEIIQEIIAISERVKKSQQGEGSPALPDEVDLSTYGDEATLKTFLCAALKSRTIMEKKSEIPLIHFIPQKEIESDVQDSVSNEYSEKTSLEKEIKNMEEKIIQEIERCSPRKKESDK